MKDFYRLNTYRSTIEICNFVIGDKTKMLSIIDDRFKIIYHLVIE